MRKIACPFGHPTQVSTQVQLAATCDYLRVRLARALMAKLRNIGETYTRYECVWKHTSLGFPDARKNSSRKVKALAKLESQRQKHEEYYYPEPITGACNFPIFVQRRFHK